MNLELTDDQNAILEAIEGLLRPYSSLANLHDFYVYNADLDRELEENGFLDIASDPDLGLVTAALVVHRVAQLPWAVEVAHSSLVRPFLGPSLPRPLAVFDPEAGSRSVRFAPVAATCLVADRTTPTLVSLSDSPIGAVDSLFGYPMGILPEDFANSTNRVDAGIDPQELLRLLRIGVSIEMAGLLKGALASCITYITERQQFGRPLGSFQGVRHRLSEIEVRRNGLYWLAMRAAASGDSSDAALAALHAQESATAAIYDFHQFMGAMGITLEHPMHFWTYRMKSLLSDLGGRPAQAAAAAAALW